MCVRPDPFQGSGLLRSFPHKTSTFKAPTATAIICASSHFKCSSDPFEQQLMIEWFCKELDRTLSHRLNPHPGIPVSRDEDDRNIAFLLFQPGLQLQTRHLRHTDIKNQARSPSMQIRFEEFFRG